MPQIAKNAALKRPRKPRPVSRAPKGGHSKSRKGSADPTAGLQVANPNAAAIDIGCSEHWVAVPAGRAEQTYQAFGCCTAELNRLADWLVACRVDTVVMEATGNYWVALPEFRIEQGRTLVPLQFAPAQSFFVVFRQGEKAAGVRKSTRVGEDILPPASSLNFPKLQSVVELTGVWSVAFDPSQLPIFGRIA